jgi:RNA polymerase sigma-70 factor (ECF subfamily)
MSQLSQNTESRTTNLGGLRSFENPSAWRAEAERDLEIVAAVQAGSSTAFDVLQRQYSRRLFWAILRITKNREDAEDALQDTFLKAFLALPQFEGRSSVNSWLSRIAINSALMILRRRRTRPQAESVSSVEGCDDYCSLQIEDKTPNPEQLCELRQRCNRAIDAIQKLTPQLRAPIEIQMASQRSMEELARELNISVPAVKTRLHRARVQLAHHNSAKAGIGALVVQ